MTGIEGNLAAEISATNADFTSVNTRISSEESLALANNGSQDTRMTGIEGDLADEITRATGVEAELSAEIVVEKGRIDAILAGSNVNLDQFAEVVAYVDSLDLADDNFLANQMGSVNTRFGSGDTRMSGIEGDLAAEIAATDSEVIRLDGKVDSLETSLDTRVAAEEAARSHGDTYAEEAVTGVAGAANAPFVFNTVAAFEMGAFDTEVYVNGVRVAFTQLANSDFELNLVYAIEPTDIVRVVGVQA